MNMCMQVCECEYVCMCECVSLCVNVCVNLSPFVSMCFVCVLCVIECEYVNVCGFVCVSVCVCACELISWMWSPVENTFFLSGVTIHVDEQEKHCLLLRLEQPHLMTFLADKKGIILTLQIKETKKIKHENI